ncbi:hypothetical protein [Jatrophihabitans sp.]|uniref:hypothetical protein n=1 Tax=Jatrophihabitans sp. TaxID=1932789 RepID=UPI002CEF2BBE|nr:hypothetical protein [Jatrophihabitans sp.]
MPNIPTPIRAALGLAATAVDEARKLPETLPQMVSTVPLRAVSTAMQASLRLQQHLATLSARGDEVLSQLRGSSAEPPSWATFDESPATADPQAGKAAFDRIDYDGTGFAESNSDDGQDRWDAVGVGGTQSDASTATPDLDTTGTAAAGTGAAGAGAAGADTAGAGAAGADDGTAPPPSGVEPAPPAASLADAVSHPDLPAAPAKAPAKAAKKAAKAAPAKAPAKAAGTKASPAKTGPAKAKRAPRKAEPLEVAASKADPSGAPTPSTMAAEILHAHEANPADE